MTHAINSVVKYLRSTLALLAVLALALGWQYAYAVNPIQSPLELVQGTANRLLAAVEAEGDVIKQNPDRLGELVDEILLPVIDKERITRWVLGRHWQRATAEQRTRFVEEFQTLLMRTYSSPLVDHSDVEITYLPFRMDPDDTDVLVRTQVRPRGRERVPVYYRLHLRDDTWKVYDVIVSGISAVTTFRTTFSDEIQRVGLEGFIRRLAELNRQHKTLDGIDLSV